MRHRALTLSATAAVTLGLLAIPGCGDAGSETTQGNSTTAQDGQSGGGGSDARRTKIHIVGSSTVHPFASYVADHFGETTRFETPNVEKTGSGGGHKLFGEGPGLDTPDITNSSRKMKVSEFKRAKENGVQSITEAKFGYDGITIAQNAENEPIDLTLEEITLAVAREVPEDGELVANQHERWSDIDSSLPDRKIQIYGPPTTSGTRDAFEELVLEHATDQMPGYDEPYTQIRQDGNFWIDSGENDNLIVQRLADNRQAFGIFGFSFLEENRNKIQGASINGVEPRPEAISSGEYPISRSLFFYIKNNRRGRVEGFTEFLETFMAANMIGEAGYLRDIGLITLPSEQRGASRKRVLEGSELRLKDNGQLTTLKDYMAGDE